MTRLFFIPLILLAGCTRTDRAAPPNLSRSEAGNSILWGVHTVNLDNLPLKTSPDGIQYKVVHIEGRAFIATLDMRGYWHFAGPID